MIEVLRFYLSPEANPNDYLLKTKGRLDQEGTVIGCRPINQGNFQRRIWRKCLESLEIRQRPFYNTRHTYISTLLSIGKPIGFVAKQVGASATVIEKHYWKWIAKSDDLTMPEGVVDAPRIQQSSDKNRYPNRYPLTNFSALRNSASKKRKEDQRVKNGGRSRTRTCDLLHVRDQVTDSDEEPK